MTAWKDVERAEPEFAQRVRGLFDRHRHKTIATLRADGLTHLNEKATMLVVEWWTPTHGLRRIERE